MAERLKPGAECNQSTQNQERISELEKVVGDKDRELLEKDQQLQAKNRDHDFALEARPRDHQAAIQAKERENQVAIQRVIASRDQVLERQRREPPASEQLVSEFQQSLQQKDKTITDLKQTISAHEIKIQQLEQQDTASKDTPHQKTVGTPLKTAAAAAAAGGRDISKMKWRKGKNAPQAMRRGAAVVHENTAYLIPLDSVKVYSYRNIGGEEQWSQLPDSLHMDCGLAVIYGILTSVGGLLTSVDGYDGNYTNIILSLSGDGERKKWSEIFPPMPTSRISVACVTTGKSRLVAGGWNGDRLNTVEVMNTNTKQWTTVSSLPEKCTSLSAAVYGDQLYLAVAGGTTPYLYSKSFYTCSLPDLLTKPSPSISPSCHVWRELSSLPVEYSALVSFGGDILAVGGRDDSNKPTSNVYRYDFHTDSWTVASHMKNKRSWCLAVSLPADHLIVVGGYTNRLLGDDTLTNTVEVIHP